jgi:hypothetical protein
MKKAIYKVPDGKLLKVFLEENEGAIKEVKIMGDFFAYPENTIELLETFLANTLLKEEEVGARVDDFFDEHTCELFGVNSNAITHTIIEAHNS